MVGSTGSERSLTFHIACHTDFAVDFTEGIG